MLTRRGNDLLGLFPEIAVDLKKLPDMAIDGELVMLDEKGKPEFHQLRGRCAIRDPNSIGVAARSKPAAVFAFDVLQLRGKDLRALPLLKRKAALQKELSRTERIVYRRLAPGVLQELRRLTPRDEKGRLKNKLFQRLTEEVGHPKLREHLMGVVMLMKYAPNWQIFMDRLDKEFPQWGDTYMLPFPEDYAPPPLEAESVPA